MAARVLAMRGEFAASAALRAFAGVAAGEGEEGGRGGVKDGVCLGAVVVLLSVANRVNRRRCCPIATALVLWGNDLRHVECGAVAGAVGLKRPLGMLPAHFGTEEERAARA